jgi:hypothetical protein
MLGPGGSSEPVMAEINHSPKIGGIKCNLKPKKE